MVRHVWSPFVVNDFQISRLFVGLWGHKMVETRHGHDPFDLSKATVICKEKGTADDGHILHRFFKDFNGLLGCYSDVCLHLLAIFVSSFRFHIDGHCVWDDQGLLISIKFLLISFNIY